jgi:hypothetical protein
MGPVRRLVSYARYTNTALRTTSAQFKKDLRRRDSDNDIEISVWLSTEALSSYTVSILLASHFACISVMHTYTLGF